MHIFEPLCQELDILLSEWEPKLTGMAEDVISQRRNSQNRTIKEIVGHMVDSASNNTHRIVHLQYQNSPIDFPDYANLGNNDRWISIQNYQAEDWQSLVRHWTYSHLHLIHVIRNINPDALDKIWISALNQPISLRDMVQDFPQHLKLHVTEIAELANLTI